MCKFHRNYQKLHRKKSELLEWAGFWICMYENGLELFPSLTLSIESPLGHTNMLLFSIRVFYVCLYYTCTMVNNKKIACPKGLSIPFPARTLIFRVVPVC